MMGLDTLFPNINHRESDEPNKILCRVKMDIDHPVFKGHFPEQPVLPGVCQLHLVNKVLENKLSKNLNLIESSNIKFLNMIDPGQDDEFDLEVNYQEIEDHRIKVNANIKNINGICLKFKGIFAPQL